MQVCVGGLNVGPGEHKDPRVEETKHSEMHKVTKSANREKREPSNRSHMFSMSNVRISSGDNPWCYCYVSGRRIIVALRPFRCCCCVHSTMPHSEPRKGRTKSNDARGVRSTSPLALLSSGDPARGVTIPLSFSPPGNPVKLSVGLCVGVVWPECVPLSSSSSSWTAGCPPTHGSLDVMECRRVCARVVDVEEWMFESEAE